MQKALKISLSLLLMGSLLSSNLHAEPAPSKRVWPIHLCTAALVMVAAGANILHYRSIELAAGLAAWGTFWWSVERSLKAAPYTGWRERLTREEREALDDHEDAPHGD